MTLFRTRFERSAVYARVAPFFIFVALTALQGAFRPDSAYWMYLLKTITGAWLVWEMRPFVREMRWNFSWEACLVGVAVCALWIGLDGLYPRLSNVEPGWNPHQRFGHGSILAWVFILVRLAGSTLVVPPLEEVFYRSFLYRYLVKLDFQCVALGGFHALSFVVTSALFGLAHPDRWLAAFLCGLAYQGLTIRKDRLGDAICAHAITNFLLGLWVICKGAWTFW